MFEGLQQPDKGAAFRPDRLRERVLNRSWTTMGWVWVCTLQRLKVWLAQLVWVWESGSLVVDAGRRTVQCSLKRVDQSLRGLSVSL
ncbi:hypothetical protein C1H46_013033 [Malus baccata]|uniref:Uncharacterized protein n=1 Tax=Malus baccata TaxID=106549 RepID=A0A540MT02_MALBA|nr:hypothetical protein C1H46_013033 [Malus baccata]